MYNTITCSLNKSNSLIIPINESGYRQKVIWDSLIPQFEYDDTDPASTAYSPRGQKVRCYLNDILETTGQTRASAGPSKARKSLYCEIIGVRGRRQRLARRSLCGAGWSGHGG